MRASATRSSGRFVGVIALCAAALLSGCSATDDTGAGRASATPTSATTSLSTSAAARFPRTRSLTALGDVSTLDVCGVAASADVRGVGSLRLERPGQANVASCVLTSRPTGTLAASGSVGSIAVSVRASAPGTAAPLNATPTTSVLAGRTLFNYPFDETLRSCPRVLVASRIGVTSAVVSIVNSGGAGNATAAQMCLLNLRIAARFAYVAAGGTRPALPAVSPSLRGINVCQAAASGRVVAAITATRAGVPTAYGTGCAYSTDLGTVELIAGTLGPDVTRPAGAVRTVAGRQFVLVPSAAPTCGYAWYLGREVMTATLTSASKSVPSDCVLVAGALTAFLDVVAPR